MSEFTRRAYSQALMLAVLVAGTSACLTEKLGPNGVAVSVAGQGKVTSDPPGITCPGTSCSNEFTHVQLVAGVSLTATAGPGFRFNRWQFSGRLPTFLSDTDSVVTLRDVDAPPVGWTILATFEPTGVMDAGAGDAASQSDSSVVRDSSVDGSPADAEAPDGGADAGPDAI